MLKGVLNIKFNSGSESSSKNIHKKYVMGGLIKENNANDSLDISKGYKILRNYNLQIKKFKKSFDEFLEVEFDLNKLSFETRIDLKNLTNYLKFEYSIKNLHRSSKFKIDVLTKTFYSQSVENKLRTKDIEYLVDRVVSLNVTSELSFSNTRALNNLLDNIYNGVLAEFKCINSVLATAAVHLFDLPLKHVINEENENEIIILEKISPEYGNS